MNNFVGNITIYNGNNVLKCFIQNVFARSVVGKMEHEELLIIIQIDSYKSNSNQEYRLMQ